MGAKLSAWKQLKAPALLTRNVMHLIENYPSVTGSLPKQTSAQKKRVQRQLQKQRLSIVIASRLLLCATVCLTAACSSFTTPHLAPTLVSADLLVSPAEFKPITDSETAADVLRHNGEICTGSREKLIRWQVWFVGQ